MQIDCPQKMEKVETENCKLCIYFMNRKDFDYVGCGYVKTGKRGGEGKIIEKDGVLIWV